MAERKKKKKKNDGAPQWLLTYGDMTTLLLVFFIAMFNIAEVDGSDLRLIMAAYQGLGLQRGGNTLEAGKMAELGNNLMTLPSVSRGRGLAKARKLAVSIFEPDISRRRVSITENERGLVVSLSAELFFAAGSAEVDMEKSRDLFGRIVNLLNSKDLAENKFRIEGHTDSAPLDRGGKYDNNWDLSTARALNVLKVLINYGVTEKKFQVAGFADTMPVGSNDTPQGRADNRRVDIVILTEGHL